MIGSIPTETEDEKARRTIAAMTPEKIAPLVVYLGSGPCRRCISDNSLR